MFFMEKYGQLSVNYPCYPHLIWSTIFVMFTFCFQGVSGNSIYSVPNAELLLSLDMSVNEFPRENLRFLEVLGEGQFGEVHLCEASNISRYVDDEYFLNRTMSRPILVAVKILRTHADDRAR